MPPTAISPARPKQFDDIRLRDDDLPSRLARRDAAHRTASASGRFQELQRRVTDALHNSGYAALEFVGCEVENGRVILCGSVPSYHLKQLAQVHTLRVDGVGRIENRLEVRRRGA